MSRFGNVHCSGADFCQELAGEPETEFGRVYAGDPPSRIIGRSANLALLADMSPLCAGHLLVVSNRHHLSFAEVVSDHGAEVEAFTCEIFDQYQRTFGRAIILEHGSADGIDGSACITHAHWHIVPLSFDATDKILRHDGLTSVDLDRLSDLAVAGGRPYFFCADQDVRRLYGVGQAMRRQYLRSVAAALLDIPDPEWDYALVVRKDLLRTTLARTERWSLRTPFTSER